MLFLKALHLRTVVMLLSHFAFWQTLSYGPIKTSHTQQTKEVDRADSVNALVAHTPSEPFVFIFRRQYDCSTMLFATPGCKECATWITKNAHSKQV